MANNPVLRQSVRWGEEYVSRALNIKFSGVIKPGIYSGFHLRPYGPMALLAAHGDDCSRSVAVVDRDGYSITVIMDDAVGIEIPAPGEWWICLEASYAPTQQGYQRIVAREKLEPHHIVLGKANLDENGLSYSEDARMDAEILTRMDIDAIRDEFRLDLAAALESASQAVVNAIDELDCKVEEAVGILNGKLAGTVEKAEEVQAETRCLLEAAKQASGMENDIALSLGIMSNANRIARLELLAAGIAVELPEPAMPDLPVDPDNTDPALPDNPADQPDGPDNPDIPVDPDPENPADPTEPDNPEQPDTPVNPGCNCQCCANKSPN